MGKTLVFLSKIEMDNYNKGNTSIAYRKKQKGMIGVEIPTYHIKKNYQTGMVIRSKRNIPLIRLELENLVFT